jgi:hypothetical protein
VDAHDARQHAVTGLACVSNSSEKVHGVLMRAIRAMENWRLGVRFFTRLVANYGVKSTVHWSAFHLPSSVFHFPSTGLCSNWLRRG